MLVQDLLLVLITIALAWIGYSLHLFVHRPREGEQTTRSLLSQKATRLAETWDALAAEAALLAAQPDNEAALQQAANRVSTSVHANAPYIGGQAIETLLAYRAAVWAAARQSHPPTAFVEQMPEINQLVRPAPLNVAETSTPHDFGRQGRAEKSSPNPRPARASGFERANSIDLERSAKPSPEPVEESGGFKGISL